MKPNFEQIFYNKSDVYADAPFTEDNIPAMSKEVFIKAMEEVWNMALCQAIVHAEAFIPFDGQEPVVSRGSILKLKV